jgi:hypothetical protein
MMFRRNGAAQLIVVWRCEIGKSARAKKSEIGVFCHLLIQSQFWLGMKI